MREVARIHGEMETIKRARRLQGHAAGVLRVRAHRPAVLSSRTPTKGREAYLQAARDYLAVMKQRLPEYLRPPAEGGSRREARRGVPRGARRRAALLRRGTPDGSRPGIYYAHLIDMNAMPKPGARERSPITRACPGHHMQISIAQELTGIPKFRTQLATRRTRKAGVSTPKRSPRRWAATRIPTPTSAGSATRSGAPIRLVVDTGMHAKGWTEEAGRRTTSSPTPRLPKARSARRSSATS